ncbi:MAG TPA: zf-HC2 domain-containing protein [Anaeromyxobacteraceae bacterium]
MTCDDVRIHLHDFQRGRLDPALHGAVGVHLEGCAACSRDAKAERVLDELLEHRLPRHAAPPALKRRLGFLAGHPPASPARRLVPARWARVAAPALAAGLALAVTGVVVKRANERTAITGLAAEAVNDHLRVLASQHPVDVESGGSHQVKPWFEGKLDFAPAVPVPEGGALQLRGGALGFVFDRKAAVLVYALRLHAVTLLVFRAEGLPLPTSGSPGAISTREDAVRGFNVVLWRGGDLGYALVSDANAKELGELASRLAAETAGPVTPRAR